MVEKVTWEAYGRTWERYESEGGTQTAGTCEHCHKACGHNFFSFGGKEGPKPTSTHVEYTVSDGKKVLAQQIKDEGVARLMGNAPNYRSLLEEVAGRDPLIGDDGWERCSFCEATPDEYPGQPRFVPHETNCLWRRIRVALEAGAKPLVVRGGTKRG